MYASLCITDLKRRRIKKKFRHKGKSDCFVFFRTYSVCVLLPTTIWWEDVRVLDDCGVELDSINKCACMHAVKFHHGVYVENGMAVLKGVWWGGLIFYGVPVFLGKLFHELLFGWCLLLLFF